MRHVCFLDNKITQKAFDSWKEEDVSFWQEHLGITPEYWVIRQDYSDYPTFTDADGDIRPTNAFLKSLNDMVVSKYGDFGTDFILVMVHEDNWKSDTDYTKGIWGTSYSYKFGDQHLEYCRWDRDNPANTFGTAYHERMHTPDALVAVELGINLDTVIEAHLNQKYADKPDIISYLNKNGFSWDRDVTHGKMKPPFSYIRWKENEEILPIIAPYLVRAFAKRKEKHEAVIEQYKSTIVELMLEVIRLLRKKLNQKDGVPRS